MSPEKFIRELDAAIARHDLLCHPFYEAWSAGTLTRDELRDYSAQYFNHVSAFPTYLNGLLTRLPEGELREAVEENYQDEMGAGSADGRPHDELWMDFNQGMGGKRTPAQPLPEMCALMESFRRTASHGHPAAALAMFYAYESQVPRVAREKAAGLRKWYGADDATCHYFDLHRTADVYHARVWRHALEQTITAEPGAAEMALRAAGQAAQALWRALDGIERARQARRAA